MKYNRIFLDVSSHLYMSVCPSVGPFVTPSVGNAFVKIARIGFISLILSLPSDALGLIPSVARSKFPAFEDEYKMTII